MLETFWAPVRSPPLEQPFHFSHCSNLLGSWDNNFITGHLKAFSPNPCVQTKLTALTNANGTTPLQFQAFQVPRAVPEYWRPTPSHHFDSMATQRIQEIGALSGKPLTCAHAQTLSTHLRTHTLPSPQQSNGQHAKSIPSATWQGPWILHCRP